MTTVEKESWIENLDLKGFGREMKELGETLRKNQVSIQKQSEPVIDFCDIGRRRRQTSRQDPELELDVLDIWPFNHVPKTQYYHGELPQCWTVFTMGDDWASRMPWRLRQYRCC